MPEQTERLWREMHGRLRGFLRGRVGEEDAYDILQEVFLRIHRGLRGRPVLRDPQAWAFQIARTTLIDHYRGRAADRTVSNDVDQSRDALRPDPPEAEVWADLAQCVKPFVDELREPYRQSLIWVGIDGLSQKEAARRAEPVNASETLLGIRAC